MVAFTHVNSDGDFQISMQDDDRLTWHLFQAKTHLESLEAVVTSRHASPLNSAVVGVALAGNASEFDSEQILDRFDRFASGEDSELLKFLYYEPRANGGTVFQWENAEPRDRTAWRRLAAAVLPDRRLPVNWSPILYRQALAYNIDPNIPFEPNLDPREIRFRILFRRVNLFLSGVSFVAAALFAEFVLRPRGIHEVVQLGLSFSAPSVSYFVGKYAGIWQLCKLQEFHSEKFNRIVFESSLYRDLRSLVILLKWNPTFTAIMLGIADAWALNTGL